MKEKDFEVETSEGLKKTFVLSKFPATEGRRIMTQYPISALISNTKIGSYDDQERLMMDLMSYVKVRLDDGREIPLKTKDLINNHCDDWEMLMKIEREMIVYNFSFFQNGKGFDFMQSLLALVVQSVTETLMGLSDKSSHSEEQL